MHMRLLNARITRGLPLRVSAETADSDWVRSCFRAGCSGNLLMPSAFMAGLLLEGLAPRLAAPERLPGLISEQPGERGGASV